jgi:hypothetical protein
LQLQERRKQHLRPCKIEKPGRLEACRALVF